MMTKAELRGVLLVAGTYIFFLIFAEFAFIELARTVTGETQELRLVMTALGIGGVLGSCLGAAWFSLGDWGVRLAAWLLGCAASAVLTLLSVQAGVTWLIVSGLSVGATLGGATVCLASGLRAAIKGGRLGLVCGAGTGVAYAVCNVPAIFEASPGTQTLLAAGLVVTAAALAWMMRPPPIEKAQEIRKKALPWVVIFLALVWMDSAAFYIIQHSEILKTGTWHGAWTLWGNATTHFLAAVLAGWLLDRGKTGWVTATAGVTLALSCNWIMNTGAQVGYVTGVSFYSAALVYVAAQSQRPWFSASLFAVAGWIGSALGIGMAQDLHRIPEWFVGVALTVLFIGLVWHKRPKITAAPVILLAIACPLVPQKLRADDAAAIIRGREVYVSEGCIHCHSQYVRPNTDDVVRWGPVGDLKQILAEQPPLIGNRRQGPDLANVGNRRTPGWNRLHLEQPRAVSPGTRMPSYGYLFKGDDQRGGNLLAYLDSLGSGTEEQRSQMITAWHPAITLHDDSSVEIGREWFSRLCIQCHGAQGRGNGPLAEKLPTRPADLTLSKLGDQIQLQQLIKFGRTGTFMAGHESLDDRTVASLALYVRQLQSNELKR